MGGRARTLDNHAVCALQAHVNITRFVAPARKLLRPLRKEYNQGRVSRRPARSNFKVICSHS